MVCRNSWPQHGMHFLGQWSRSLEGSVLCLEVCWKTDAATLSRSNKGEWRNIRVTVSLVRRASHHYTKNTSLVCLLMYAWYQEPGYCASLYHSRVVRWCSAADAYARQVVTLGSCRFNAICRREFGPDDDMSCMYEVVHARDRSAMSTW